MSSLAYLPKRDRPEQQLVAAQADDVDRSHHHRDITRHRATMLPEVCAAATASFRRAKRARGGAMLEAAAVRGVEIDRAAANRLITPRLTRGDIRRWLAGRAVALRWRCRAQMRLGIATANGTGILWVVRAPASAGTFAISRIRCVVVCRHNSRSGRVNNVH